MAAMLHDFVRTYVRRTRPRAMPLATMTMKTQTHGFPIFYVRMNLWGSTLRPFGPLWSSANIIQYFGYPSIKTAVLFHVNFARVVSKYMRGHHHQNPVSNSVM